MYEMLHKSVDDRHKRVRETAKKNNRTGIPERTKAYFEDLSGMSFDDVRVHYASPKPAGFGALAYTQGNDVYIGPGQEKHLGHELFHVVQQKQGRVPPTGEIGGTPVNTDSALEREADRAGSLAERNERTVSRPAPAGAGHGGRPVIQGRFPSVKIKRSIQSAGQVSGHHIFSQADLGRLSEAALRKKRSGTRKMEWPGLYAFCEEYCECEGGIENLGFNIVAGPGRYINNPGDRFDPQTQTADMDEGDVEYLGMTEEQAEQFGVEKRELTYVSECMKAAHDKCKDADYEKWKDSDWEEILDSFRSAEEEAGRGPENVLLPCDEWAEEQDGSGRDTYYRKRQGYFMSRAAYDGVNNVFSVGAQKRKYTDLENLEVVDGQKEITDESGGTIQVQYSVFLKHILERHSFLWCRGEFTGINIFFPLSMDEDAIRDWCMAKAEAHIEKVICPAADSGELDFSQSGVYDDVFLICSIGYDEPMKVTFETMSMESGGIQVTQKALKEAWDVYEDQQ